MFRTGRIASAVAALAFATSALPLAPAASAAPAADGPVGGPALAARGVVLNPGPQISALPKVTALTWVLADAESGEILAAKAPHLPRPPASTLKTLTALALLPGTDLGATYTAVDADIRVEGSRVGMVAGGTYTFEQLFTAMFLPSANDAATAIARSRGSVRASVERMNSEARRLQAFDTVAKNPTGLDSPGQVSSAYDLALFGRASLTNPEIARWCRQVKATFPGKMPKRVGAKRSTFEIYTENRSLLRGYTGALGVKNGYTTKAGRTFIGAAKRGDRTLIVALMGIDGQTWRASESLLNWGFKNADRVTPVGQLVDPVQPADASAAGVQAAADTASTAGPSTLGRNLGLLAVAGVLGVLGWFFATTSGAMRRRRLRRSYR